MTTNNVQIESTISSQDHRKSSDAEKGGDVIVEDVGGPGLGRVRERHGRVDLVPMPSDSPNDPLNWPSWRKHVLLFIVAFHAMQGPFGAAMVIPGFESMALEFHTTVPRTSYFVSVQIVFLGVLPLLWAPVASRIGRRPVYLLSALISSACALAGGYCHSYGTLMTTRVFQAIFISPPLSIGASTVGELFFSYQKGSKMGIWALLVTCGSLLGPLVTGFLIQVKGWRTSFYLLAAIHLALFFAHLFFGPETLYPSRAPPGKVSNIEDERTRTGWRGLVAFRVYDRRWIPVSEILRPLIMAVRPVVVLPALAYALTFGHTNVLMTILVPQLFGEIFHLTPGQIGLQFIALLIGAVLGEQLGGYGSDQLVSWRTRRAGGERVPEYRLGLAVPGFLLAIIGLIVWGVQLQNATPGQWNVTPDIGSAIAMFGLQIVTTVCYTYAVESYISETADVSVFVALVRQVYGFIAPFYLPNAYVNLGAAKASGLFAALIGLGMILVMACNIWGAHWRERSYLKLNKPSVH